VVGIKSIGQIRRVDGQHIPELVRQRPAPFGGGDVRGQFREGDGEQVGIDHRHFGEVAFWRQERGGKSGAILPPNDPLVARDPVAGRVIPPKVVRPVPDAGESARTVEDLPVKVILARGSAGDAVGHGFRQVPKRRPLRLTRDDALRQDIAVIRGIHLQRNADLVKVAGALGSFSFLFARPMFIVSTAAVTRLPRKSTSAVKAVVPVLPAPSPTSKNDTWLELNPWIVTDG